MAADSQVTGGDIRRGEVQKLWPVKGGGIFAMAGAAGYAEYIAAWLSAGAEPNAKPHIPEGVEVHGLYVSVDQRLAVISSDLVLQWVEASYHAQGSGNELAMGAMAMGASAEQAVAVAAQFDVFTGGAIHTMRVGAART